MNQSELDRAVAARTGEGVAEIERRGFVWADPLDVSFYPEPVDMQSYLDWEEVDAMRMRVLPR